MARTELAPRDGRTLVRFHVRPQPLARKRRSHHREIVLERFRVDEKSRGGEIADLHRVPRHSRASIQALHRTHPLTPEGVRPREARSPRTRSRPQSEQDWGRFITSGCQPRTWEKSGRSPAEGAAPDGAARSAAVSPSRTEETPVGGPPWALDSGEAVEDSSQEFSQAVSS